MTSIVLEELNGQREQLALESSDLANNLIASVKRIFPSIMKSFASVGAAFSPSEPGVPLTSNQEDFLDLISHYTYLDLAQTRTFVPEGMHSTYLDYGHTLLDASEQAVKVVDTLNTYSTYLAMIITNKNSELSTKNNNKFYEGMESRRNTLHHGLGAHFATGKHETNTTYGKVVARNSDWKEVFALSDKISTTLNTVDRKALIQKTKETNEYMQEIIRMIDDGQLENMSPAVANEFAEGAYQIASELEFFSLTYYRGMAFTTAVNDTVKRIREVFKD